MIELADLFRQYGPAYRAKFGDQMLPSHRAAMRAIEQCRTAALGGHVYYCPACEESWYSYHSCPGALVSWVWQEVKPVGALERKSSALR